MSTHSNNSIVQEGTNSNPGEGEVHFTVDGTIVLIYTYVVFTGVCQLINIFGIVTNCINIVCFAKQGFKDTINVSLLGLSVSDLCSLITMVWTCIFLTPAVVTSDCSFASNGVTYLVSGIPHFSFTRVSTCITAMITLERCISIVAPLRVKTILTPHRTAVAIVCIFIIFTFSITPVYLVNSLIIQHSPLSNRSILTLAFTDNKDAVEKITFTINNFLIPLVAFVIVTTSTMTLTIQLQKQTKWRKTSIPDSQADRISSRNQKIAKMVVTISTLFIICFVPSAIIMLAVAFEPALSVNGQYLHMSVFMFGMSYILEGVNSSMNICIYHSMSGKYRDTFNQMFSSRKINSRK